MATFTERLLLVVDAESQGATRGLNDVTDATRKTDRAFDDLGRKSQGLGNSLKAGLALGAGALIGGGLADAVLNIGRDFLEAAKGVEMFSNATNSTVEESSRFMGMAKAMGLDVNDLLEIVAEFGPKAEAMKDELAGVGIELQKNADGSVNVGRSLENALTGLQQIPDDAQRMQMAMKLFGEEGSKQLASIYNGTKPVAEAMEDLDLGIDAGDIEKARNFNEAMMDLKGAGRDVGFTLASAVLPAITGIVQALGPLAEVLGKIQPEVLLLGGGLFALSRFGGGLQTAFSNAVTGIRGLGDNIRYQQTLAAGYGVELGKVRAAGEALKGTGSAIVNSISPAGAAIGTAMVATQLYTAAIDAAEAATREAIPRFNELKESGMSAGDALKQTAQEIDANASVMERFGAEMKGGNALDALIGPQLDLAQAFTAGGDSAKGFEETLREQTEAMGPAAAAAADMALAQKDLNDLITEGASVNSGAFASAVRDAAQAQVEQKTNTDLATAAIDAYIASTTGAVDATLAASSSTYAQSDAFRSAQTAIAEAAVAVDDSSTVIDEAAASQDAAGQAALRYAAASLQAAQDQAALQGQVLSASQEVDVQIAALQTLQQQPGISETTKANIQGLIDQLTTAKTKGDEGVAIDVTEEGAAEAGTAIDTASDPRTAEITAESRNGPAVISYLDGIAAKDRLAVIRAESRNGPAVITYLDSIASERLALIRVESRNGPAVITYLDSIAAERLAIIRVESRNGPAVVEYLNSIANPRTAPVTVQQRAAGAAAATGGGATGMSLMLANPEATVAPIGRVSAPVRSTVVQRTYRIVNEVAPGGSPVEVGRATVSAIRAFERSAGQGWRN